MNIRSRVCDFCLGEGKVNHYRNLGISENGYGAVKLEKMTCPVCEGRRSVDYAEFTVDEGKAILKFCGLSTES